MSDRLRRNLYAGSFVLIFLVGVASQSIAADPIVSDSTVTSTGTQTTTIIVTTTIGNRFVK